MKLDYTCANFTPKLQIAAISEKQNKMIKLIIIIIIIMIKLSSTKTKS